MGDKTPEEKNSKILGTGTKAKVGFLGDGCGGVSKAHKYVHGTLLGDQIRQK